MNHSVPNLPSRNFDQTREFYASIGFSPDFQDEGWMILRRESLVLEFFPHPKLKPLKSWFSCCLRLDDLDEFFAECRAAKIVESDRGAPRLHAPKSSGGMKIGALIDIDGTLLRLIQN